MLYSSSQLARRILLLIEGPLYLAPLRRQSTPADTGRSSHQYCTRSFNFMTRILRKSLIQIVSFFNGNFQHLPLVHRAGTMTIHLVKHTCIFNHEHNGQHVREIQQIMYYGKRYISQYVYDEYTAGTLVFLIEFNEQLTRHNGCT